MGGRDSTTPDSRKERAAAKKWDKRTWKVGRYLLPLIDPHDWAAATSKGMYREPSARLEAWMMGEPWQGRHARPQQLTKTVLQQHLRGQGRYYYVSKRNSGFALLRIDIDAHEGQQDVGEAVQLVRGMFSGAYDESSPRGWSIYILVHTGMIPRVEFNRLAGQFGEALSVIFRQHGIESTVEIGGTFTTKDKSIDTDTGEERVTLSRGKLAPIPAPQTEAQVRRLINAPIHHAAHLRKLIAEAGLVSQIEQEQPDYRPTPLHSLKGCVTRLGLSDCAFARMQGAYFAFTRTYHRIPALHELLEAYHAKHGGSADEARINRAISVLKLAKDFDPLAAKPGFSTRCDELVAAVSEHCLDRTTNYQNQITDEDLAIGLYVAECSSFAIADDPRHQFTMGRDSIIGTFRKLKSEGVTSRGCNNDKAVALKLILERARLIECLDSDYLFRGNSSGISKKYSIGPAHPRYADFCRFAEGVEWQTIQQLREAAEQRRSAPAAGLHLVRSSSGINREAVR